MYIGGTDERALHHLVAEVLDNSMDEAVAGHASRIEVEVHADHSVTIRDNGRGIPVDPHPKFPDKSALEVILCTLHAGGKFSGKAYQTSGGLHGVGVSVVNALSDHLRVEVARNRELFVQEFSRGLPQGPIRSEGAVANRRGTSVTFHADEEIFGHHRFKPARLFKMVRSKAYLFSGVEIRWKSGPRRRRDPDRGRVPLPRRPVGLPDRDHRRRSHLYRHALRRKGGVPAQVRRPRLRRMGDHVDTRARRVHPVLLQHRAHARGRHARGRLLGRDPEGRARLWRAVGNRKAGNITRDDLTGGGCALVSCFIAEPEFVGQTKDRLATTEAARLVEAAVRDHFDNWLAGQHQGRGLDPRFPRAPGRGTPAAPGREGDGAQDGDEEAAPARQAGRLLPIRARRDGAVHRRGRQRGRLGQDGAGPKDAGAILPLRGKILNVLGAASSKLGQNAEISDLCQALGVGMGTRFNIEDLRYDKVIIMTDADVDGAHIASLLMTFFSKMKEHFKPNQKVDMTRFKGLGEMNPAQLKETTMNPATRTLARVTLPDSMDELTEMKPAELINTLMGKKAELRFRFIQENAAFVEDLDI
jgi:topoisomerase-4 subunit B